MRKSVLLLTLFLSVLLPASISAQVELTVSAETPWTHLVTKNGVRFSFIFYNEADSQNGGVVMRLDNENNHSVRYSFRVIFKAGSAEKEELVTGTLQAGQSITGSEDGLYWVPWTDKRQVEQVGLRAYKVYRL